MDSVAERLNKIIFTKRISKKEFCDRLGWRPTYLSQLLAGNVSLGLQPIKALLNEFSDIDARWLVTGDGYMYGTIEESVAKRADFLLSLEKYLPVMNEAERNAFVSCIASNDLVYFSKERVKRWEELLQERNEQRERILRVSMNQSVK